MEIKQHTSLSCFKHHTSQNTLVKEEISREIKKYFDLIENKNTTCQNLWETAKAMLREKFMALNAYIGKREDLKLISKLPC